MYYPLFVLMVDTLNVNGIGGGVRAVGGCTYVK